MQHPVTIRVSRPRDADALSRLAQLEARPGLTGRALVAVALTSGRVIADPSYPTAGLVRQLRRRRYELLRQSGPSLRPRLVLST